MKDKLFLVGASVVVILAWVGIASNFLSYLKTEKTAKSSGKESGNFYQVDLTRKENIDPTNFELLGYLNTAFKQSDGKIVYDIRNVNPYKMWNQDEAVLYYLTGATLDPDDNYSTSLFSIEIKRADEALLPFLYNSQYCQADTDCEARNEGCAYGGFNYYSDYMQTYNCGDSVDKDGVVGNGTPYIYGKADASVGCPNGKVWVEYNGASCVSNTCRGSNRTTTCQRN